MPQKFQCKKCSADLIVLNLDRGKYARCPECDTINPVPDTMEITEKALNCRININQPVEKPESGNDQILSDAEKLESPGKETAKEEKKETDKAPDLIYHQTETHSPQDNIRITLDGEDTPGGKSPGGKPGSSITFIDFLKRIEPRIYVTPALIAINFIIFIMMSIAGVPLFSPEPENLFSWGIKYTPLVMENNEWWRLFTCAFVHIGVLHLLSNMAALFVIGNICERLFGSIPFLLIYIAAALGGSTAGFLFNPLYSSAGASGAIMGIAGALIPLMIRKFTSPGVTDPRYLTDPDNPGVPGSKEQNQALLFLFSRRIIILIIVFSSVSMIIGFLVPFIDNMGHLGGFLSGIGIGFILMRKRDAGNGETANKRIGLAAAAIAGILAAAIGLGNLMIKPVVPAIKLNEYFRKQQFGKALDIIKQNPDILSKIPGGMQFEAILYGNAGWEYYLKDDFRTCIELSEKAYAIDPVLGLYARYNTALCYLRLNEIEKSKALYAELESSPVKIEIENRKGAIRDLRDLIDRNIHASEAREILLGIFRIPETDF